MRKLHFGHGSVFLFIHWRLGDGKYGKNEDEWYAHGRGIIKNLPESEA